MWKQTQKTEQEFSPLVCEGFQNGVPTSPRIQCWSPCVLLAAPKVALGAHKVPKWLACQSRDTGPPKSQLWKQTVTTIFFFGTETCLERNITQKPASQQAFQQMNLTEPNLETKTQQPSIPSKRSKPKVLEQCASVESRGEASANAKQMT